MFKNLLVAILALAVVIELGLALGGFFAPALMLEAFHVGPSAETLFLAGVIAWIVLAIGLVAALALRWVLQNNRDGWILSLLLGTWWIAIGIGLFAQFGVVENLFIDSLKGALLVAFALKSRPPT